MDNKKVSSLKAIREYCLDCSSSSHIVKTCNINDCPLYEFRLGKNPNYKKRDLTEEQREVMAERLRKNVHKKSL